jgi:hypothetical protein
LATVLGFLFLRRLRPRVRPAPAAAPAPDETNELAELVRRDPELVARALVGMMSEV